VSDTATISGAVDSLILVTNLSALRKPDLSEFKRVVESCPTTKLGFVLTDAQIEESTYGTRPYEGYDSGRARERVS
jgi:hypothetical protein